MIGYLVGGLERRHLRNCRATKTFSLQDFDLLDRFLNNFHQLVTTPHILTEVSNLAGRLPQPLHREFQIAFHLVINSLSEQFEPSKTVAAHRDFPNFGLTDTGIAIVAPGKHLVLTEEAALFGLLQKRGVDVVNFNHLRAESWR